MLREKDEKFANQNTQGKIIVEIIPSRTKKRNNNILGFHAKSETAKQMEQLSELGTDSLVKARESSLFFCASKSYRPNILVSASCHCLSMVMFH